MSTERPTRMEPIVLERIVVEQNKIQYMLVPEDEPSIRDVAQWVASFGDTEVRDIGPDGFRYRTVSEQAVGRWQWIEPGAWMARYEHEFDSPHDSPYPWGDGWEQTSGPPRPPEYGWDDDSEEGTA